MDVLVHVNSVEPELLVIPAVGKLPTVAVTAVLVAETQPVSVSLASA
jgi:hypothetical protein